MRTTPLFRQFLVASSPLLASVSVGGLVGYPNVLLPQLQSNDTIIELDLDTSSWIGSIHGLAGTLSIFMPMLMQWKGRKIAFLISCILIVIGCILAYVATSVTTILISESFHGLGSSSILMVCTSSMSEMLKPKYRNTFMTFYIILTCVGLSVDGILGQYVHWKTMSLIFLAPIGLALLNAWLVWPESPSWLAIKGRYAECERSFKWLRGDDKQTQQELLELLSASKKFKSKEPLHKRIRSKDFYVPAILMLFLINSMYWNGVLVIIIYFVDVAKISSGNNIAASNGMIAMNVVTVLFTIICALLGTRFNNKTLLIVSTFGALCCLVFCLVVTSLQTVSYLKGSLLCMYGLIVYMALCSLGVTTLGYNIAMEIMPVKHRGIGGALYIIYSCVLHSSSLKAAPYMFLYMGLYGTFLIYSLSAIMSIIVIWKFVPETKNRTLQELEDYFNYGKFVKRVIDEDVCDPNTRPLVELNK